MGPRPPDLDAVAANAFGLAPALRPCPLPPARERERPRRARAGLRLHRCRGRGATAASTGAAPTALDEFPAPRPRARRGQRRHGRRRLRRGAGARRGPHPRRPVAICAAHVVVGAGLGRAADAVSDAAGEAETTATRRHCAHAGSVARPGRMPSGSDAGRPCGAATADAAGPALRELGVRGAAARRLLAEPPTPPAGIRSRAAAVGASFRRAASAGTVARSPIGTDLEAVRDLIAGHLADIVSGLRSPDLTGPLARHAAATVTPPRPFLRWDPVPPPVVVPLTAFTEGESLRVVVVRSGVTQDPVTLEVTTQDPAAYAASVAAIAPLYADEARSATSPRRRPARAGRAARRVRRRHRRGHPGRAPADAGLGAARERHLLRQGRAARSPTPTGAPRRRSSGVHLLPEPVGGDHFNPSDPDRPLKVLPPAPAGTPDKLVLQPWRRPCARAVRRPRHPGTLPSVPA